MNQTQHPKPAPQQIRSASLLPADEADPAPEVAEEVAFDLQSEQARKIGAMPPAAPAADPAAAIAEALGAPVAGSSESNVNTTPEK